MLGTTINREGIREDIDNRDYTYSPDRPVPSFDARLGRQQPTYDRYAAAEVVNQRPAARQDMYAPAQDPAREDLWNRLNTNNVSRGAVENRYSGSRIFRADETARNPNPRTGKTQGVQTTQHSGQSHHGGLPCGRIAYSNACHHQCGAYQYSVDRTRAGSGSSGEQRVRHKRKWS